MHAASSTQVLPTENFAPAETAAAPTETETETENEHEA